MIAKHRKIKKEDSKHEYLVDILCTWAASPALFYNDLEGSLTVDALKPVFKGICSCMCSPNESLRVVACQTMSVLLSTDVISPWETMVRDCSRDICGTNAWIIASHVMIVLSRLLLTMMHPESGIELCITRNIASTCAAILGSRNSYMVTHQTQHVNVPHRFAATIAMEAAFLGLVSTSDVELSRASALCLAYLAEEVEVSRAASDTPSAADLGEGTLLSSLADNYLAYSEIRKIVYEGSAIFQMGNQLFQSKVRRALRLSAVPTPGNMGGWKEMYRIWRYHLGSILKFGLLGNSETEVGQLEKQKSMLYKNGASLDLVEWSNLTGMLCALGNVCISEPYSTKGMTSPFDGSSDNLSANELNDGNGQVQNHARQFLHDFMLELTVLLSCSHVLVREATKEFLSNEISGGIVVIMLSCFEQGSSKLFSTEGDPIISERNLTQVENILQICKLLLNRADDIYGQTELNTHSKLARSGFDMAKLISIHVRYIHSAVEDPLIAVAIRRIKICVCQILDTLIKQKELLGIKKEHDFRNEMLHVVLEWNSTFSRVKLTNFRARRD
jgi:hypothetical protein